MRICDGMAKGFKQAPLGQNGPLMGKEQDLTVQSITERLHETLADFIADWGLDVEISPQTRLVEDLEFDSIDVIQFVVAMESAFQNRSLGFQNLLMQDGRYVDDLSLAQIEAFLSARLAKV